MDKLINWFITKTWKSDYFRSWVLAQARVIGASLGSALVLHGFADQGMAEIISGFIVAAASYYLQHLDVKLVDGKIKVALLTTVETFKIETKELPPVVDEAPK